MGKGENVHCNLIRTRLTCSWLRVLSRNEELKTSHVLPACLHDVMGTFFLILFIRQCVERDEREIKKGDALCSPTHVAHANGCLCREKVASTAAAAAAAACLW